MSAVIVPGRSLVSSGTGLQCTAVSRAVCDTSLKSWPCLWRSLWWVLSEMKVQMASNGCGSHISSCSFIVGCWEATEGNILMALAKILTLSLSLYLSLYPLSSLSPSLSPLPLPSLSLSLSLSSLSLSFLPLSSLSLSSRSLSLLSLSLSSKVSVASLNPFMHSRVELV